MLEDDYIIIEITKRRSSPQRRRERGERKLLIAINYI
jgi:hypothetical protein